MPQVASILKLKIRSKVATKNVGNHHPSADAAITILFNPLHDYLIIAIDDVVAVPLFELGF